MARSYISSMRRKSERAGSLGLEAYTFWGTGWVGLDKNRYKPRICFPSLRLAFHSSKALREQVLDCFI